MGRDVIIVVKGDSKGLDPTLQKLAKMGEIDEKNAKQFEANQKKYQAETKRTVGILENARLRERKLTEARELSNDPKKIKRYNSLLEQQRARIREVTGESKKQVKQMSKLQGTIQSIGPIMLAAFSVHAIINFGKELKDLAIQLEADAKKNAIVFGDSLGYVTEQANANANAIGLTSNEYIRASASTQDLLVPLGLARSKAAEMSTELTDLSGALSVWSGGTKSATEVSEILTKTILGETEQIKTLGIKIDQTSPAFNQRIKDTMRTTGVSLEQAKALEILNQITEKSVDAQTSFADGQKTMVQQEAELSAKFRETKEVIAVQLQPVYLAFLEGTQKEMEHFSASIDLISEGFNTWAEDTENMLRFVGEFIGVVDKIDPSVKKTNESLKATTEILEDVGAKSKEIEKPIETLGSLNKKLADMRAQLMGEDVAGAMFKSLQADIKRTEKRIEQLTGKTKKALDDTGKAEKKRLEDNLKELRTWQAKHDEILKLEKERRISIAEETEDITLNLTKTGAEFKIAQLELRLKREISLLDSSKTDEAELIRLKTEETEKEVTRIKEEETERQVEISQDAADKRFKIEKQNADKTRALSINTVGELRNTIGAYTNWRITELDNAIKRGEISEEEAAVKKKELLTKQAQKEKIFSIFDITLKTAQSIMAALTIPPPAGPILAAANGTFGAIQLGIAQSTPIPEFRKGTKGKKGSGMARVGEEGEEFVFLPDGAKVLPNKQTMQYGDILDAMYDNRLDDHLLKNYIPNMLPQQQTKGAKDDLFINKMINGLGREGFHDEGIIDALGKLNKAEGQRLNVLIEAITKSNNKRVNNRRNV